MAQQLPSLGHGSSVAEGDLRLPRPPGVIRRFWARHPWWTDGLITAVYALPILLGSLSVAVLSPTVHANAFVGVVGMLMAAGSGAAVLFRRRFPLWALALAILCTFVTVSSQGGYLSLGVCLVLYAVAVYRSNRAAWIGLACAFAALTAGAFLPLPRTVGIAEASHPVSTWTVLMLVSVLIGVNIGNRKRYVQALIDRAAQLARERDQQARLATAAERSRIARELHDIVSHSLTVMITLADGSAAANATDPARAADAMRTVADTGRHALGDMRRMLDLLAEPAPPQQATREPQPTASDLSELVERFRSAGLPARLTLTGVAPDDHGLQLTIYRLVQESLTNVLRHAPGATEVTVTVTYQPTRVEIRVEDSGVADSAAAAGAGSAGTRTAGAGRGLLGMHERVSVYRGTLEAGPRPSGGWRVNATLHPIASEGTQ